MLKTYHGSCHCGAVRYEAEMDLQAETHRCNCSFCAKARNWGVTIKPAAFRQLAGEDALTEYTFNSKSARHLFCKHCGGRPFSRGDVPEIGGAYVSVNVACIDDISQEELATLPVKYMNGRDNDWWHEPAHTAHL
jgi:hypothetical protein